MAIKAKTRTTIPDPETRGDRADYVVADKAPSHVAGKRVRPGDTLRLTEAEARFEVLAGHIRRVVVAAG